MTTLTTDVASGVLDLASQVAAFGWDNGVGLWAIHPQHESGEIAFEKLGGPDYPEINPVDILNGFPPPPPCYAGLVISFEAWKVEQVPVGATGERKIDVRYVIAVLRSQTAVVFEQVRDRKPALRIAPVDRPMAGNESLLMIVSQMRQIVTAPAPQMEVHVVPMDGEMLRRLFGGE